MQHLQTMFNHMPTFQGLIASAILLSMTFYFGIQKNYINDIRSYSHRSMEILRPYVSENDYYLMKSEYFQVKSEEDFKKFNLKLTSHASKNNVNLPVSVISK
ncbi:hypothetical protein [Candidatus Sulfurimonas baltica]|uniref:Uncharacterized protein n=1 Tax=Candidatus Sulfurimonas baltica TaxID=2740404 RepID=A0A7S7RNB5_9BACT|nr:hypothetical protein [Candidatus Sulfurimonas baltica]QOY53142.1 hypothetical protein HUE88_05540 [Candidatus Sulfurimonas baltica]